MDLPNIPSDTIYKFSTVLGAVMIIFSLTTWFNRIDKNSEKINEASKKNIRHLIEQSYLKNDIEMLAKKLDTFSVSKIIDNKSMYYSNSKNIYAPSFFEMKDSIFLYKYELKESFANDSLLVELTNSLNYKIRVLEENRWELLTERRLQKYYSFNNKFIQSLLIISIILGFTLNIWGFVTWQKKEKKRIKKKK